MIKTLYYLTRPLAAVPFAFAFTFGAWASETPDLKVFSIMLVALIFGLTSGAHIVNAIADRHLDKATLTTKDIPLNHQPLATGQVSVGSGSVLATAFFILGWLPFWAYSLSAALVAGALMLLALAYSVGPRLKGRAPFDILANALGAGLVFYLGFLTAPQTVNAFPLMLLIWLMLLVGATYTLTVMADEKNDRAAGLNTAAVHYGLKALGRAAVVIYFLSLAAFIWQMYLSPWRWPWLLLPFLFWGLKSYIKLWHKPTAARAEYMMRRAAIAAAASVVLVFGLYFGLHILWLIT